MRDILLSDAKKEDAAYITNQLVKYNSTKVLFEKEPPYLHINKCIKKDNEVIGGILSELYWNVLHIDILWIKEEHRGNNYATMLLRNVENTAKEKNCKIAHLYTYDFQAKDFYIKHGYKVFGELEDSPEGHSCYFMSKRLSNK